MTEIIYTKYTLSPTDSPVIGNFKNSKKLVTNKYYSIMKDLPTQSIETKYIKIKPIIICIVGASGSGKTSLSLHLDYEYNIPAICSYTTRPMREGETNGVEHYFVNEFKDISDDDILAYTMYGGYHYWTTHSQIKTCRSHLWSYVIDKRGLDEFKNKWADRYDIISVLITRNNRDNIDSERKNRDLENPTDGEYDIIIDNNFYELTEFYNYAVDQIKPIIEKFIVNNK